MGAFIFNRLNDNLLQQLPTLEQVRIDNKHKYVVPFPDQFDLKLASYGAQGNLFSLSFEIGRTFDSQFPQYGNRVSNWLTRESDFDSAFDQSARFPHQAIGEFLDTSYMMGDVPNTLCITGRSPRATRNESVSINLNASGNHCLITQEIDIEASTDDGLGRASFMLYWCDGYRQYTKDSTSLNKTTGGISETNVTGESLLRAGSEEEPLLRAFISADNGASYTEVTNLTPITFPDRKARIRLAWVNPSTIDTHLLTYTLMY
jgi:hypothetical protein